MKKKIDLSKKYGIFTKDEFIIMNIEIACCLMKIHLSNKEKEVLKEYVKISEIFSNILSKPSKEIVAENINIKMATINVYNATLKKKGFIILDKNKQWILNPLIDLDNKIDSLDILITLKCQKHTET